MNLACQDTAGRGRFVALLSQVQAKINAHLGIKKMSINQVLGSDPLLDIFTFLSRDDLDMLQLVDARFHNIIADKMSLLCVRRLRTATILRPDPDGQFVLVFNVKQGRGNVRFPTGETEEFPAFVRLLGACRSAAIDFLHMYGNEPIQPRHIDALTRYAPLIVGVKTLSLNRRILAEDISQSTILRVLDSLTGLENKIHICAPNGYTAEMQKFLVSRGDIFELEWSHCFDLDGKLQYAETCIDGDDLLHFSFGEYEERYAKRERRLTIYLSKLSPSFLKRWIERAERVQCRHRCMLVMYFNTALDLATVLEYRRGNGDLPRMHFASNCGRSWNAIYESWRVTKYLKLMFD